MPTNVKVFIGILAMAIVFSACDTSLNVKSPEASYFLKYFGQEGSQTGIDMVENSDGTMVLFGTARTGDNDPQFFLVKSDKLGNFVWQQTFGKGICQAVDVELTSSGDIVIVGNIIPPGRTDHDVFVQKYDQNGDSIGSSQTYRYTKVTGGEADDIAHSISETNDGFIVAGGSDNIATSSPIATNYAFFMRLDQNLGQYSQGTWPIVPANGQGQKNVAVKIVQLAAGGFYVFGYTNYDYINGTGSADFNFWYFKLENDGSPDSVSYLGTSGSDERLFSVAADVSPAGTGFFLGGLQNSLAGNRLFITRLKQPPLAFIASDALLIPPTSFPQDLGSFSAILNPPYPSDEWISVCAASDGFLALTNETTAVNNNLWLVKFTGLGNLVWGPVIYGGPGDDFAGSVKVLSDGKIAIIGTMTVGQPSGVNSETKMVLIKVNKDGQFQQ